MAQSELSQRGDYTEFLENSLVTAANRVLEPFGVLRALLRQPNLSYALDEFVSCLGYILEAIAEKGYNELDTTLLPSLKEETARDGENETPDILHNLEDNAKMSVDKWSINKQTYINVHTSDLANKSAPFNNAAHITKNWMNPLLSLKYLSFEELAELFSNRHQPFELAELAALSSNKSLRFSWGSIAIVFSPFWGRMLVGNERIKKSSWKGSDVPEILVKHYDDWLQDLVSASIGIAFMLSNQLYKFSTKLAEFLVQKRGVPANLAYDHIKEVADALFKNFDPKPLYQLITEGSENLRSKYKELLKSIRSLIDKYRLIRLLIESIENLFRRHALMRMILRMLEHKLLEKASTDEKPLNTIAVNSLAFPAKGYFEKPPPKSNKVSPRFVAPSILTPSAPPCA